MKLSYKIIIATLLMAGVLGGGLYYFQSKQVKNETDQIESHTIKNAVVSIQDKKYIKGAFKNVSKKSKVSLAGTCIQCVFVPYLIFTEDGVLLTGLETRQYEIKKGGFIFYSGSPESEFMIKDENTIVGISPTTSCCVFKRMSKEEFEKEFSKK